VSNAGSNTELAEDCEDKNPKLTTGQAASIYF